MSVRKITIPAAGEELPVAMTGKSVQVLHCPLYDSYEDVPRLGFNGGNDELLIFPLSKYQFNQAGRSSFDQLIIRGTDQSAGDEIVLMTVSECIGTEMKVQYRDTYEKTLKSTFTIAADDTVQEFSSIQMENNGLLPTKAYIYVVAGATRGINYAFDADPTQGDGAADALYWDNDRSNTDYELTPLVISGINFIDAFRFIATVNTETPILIVTFEY